MVSTTRLDVVILALISFFHLSANSLLLPFTHIRTMLAVIIVQYIFSTFICLFIDLADGCQSLPLCEGHPAELGGIVCPVCSLIWAFQ